MNEMDEEGRLPLDLALSTQQMSIAASLVDHKVSPLFFILHGRLSVSYDMIFSWSYFRHFKMKLRDALPSAHTCKSFGQCVNSLRVLRPLEGPDMF